MCVCVWELLLVLNVISIAPVHFAFFVEFILFYIILAFCFQSFMCSFAASRLICLFLMLESRNDAIKFIEFSLVLLDELLFPYQTSQFQTAPAINHTPDLAKMNLLIFSPFFDSRFILINLHYIFVPPFAVAVSTITHFLTALHFKILTTQFFISAPFRCNNFFRGIHFIRRMCQMDIDKLIFCLTHF